MQFIQQVEQRFGYVVKLFGIGLSTLAYMYLRDITQPRHAIRRNYPVLGRFRYLFEHLGSFVR